MTDDRDQPWLAFTNEPEGSRFDDEAQRSETAEHKGGKTLSRALQKTESEIDRTVETIDHVIDDLRAAARLPREPVKAPPVFPWRRPDAAAFKAEAGQRVAKPTDATSVTAKPALVASSVPVQEVKAAVPAPQTPVAKPAQAAAAQTIQNVENPATAPQTVVASVHKPAATTEPTTTAASTVKPAEAKALPGVEPAETKTAVADVQPAAKPEAPAQPSGKSVADAEQKPAAARSTNQVASAANPGAAQTRQTTLQAPAQSVSPQATAWWRPVSKPSSPAPQQAAVATPETKAPVQSVGAAPKNVAPAEPVAKTASEPVAKAPEARSEPLARPRTENQPTGMITLESEQAKSKERLPDGGGPNGGDNDRGGGGGGGGGGPAFHKRLGPIDFSTSLKAGMAAVKKNLIIVMIFTLAANILVLAIPVYLFQISDRVLTSRSTDTLIMLTTVIVGAVVLQTLFDAIRRFILMRTAVEVAAQLGAPILSAAARASLHGNGREYQTLGDLQQLRTFLTSGTLLAFLDAPLAPIFILAVFLIHPDQGFIVVTAAILLLIITLMNQRATEAPFGEANSFQSKANVHLDSMARNSQIINALAMIPEAVRIWGRDTASSLRAQVIAQDRNISFAALSKGVRLLTQVTMLGWGAHLAIDGHVTGGMVIAASIIAGRALGPIEGAIEGWNNVVQVRAAYGRIAALLRSSPLNLERLNLPRPEGRLDVERLLFVPQGTKRVVLNGVTFSLSPGDSVAIIGNSGAGKTTLGKMLVGSILPTSGNVRLDLMDLRNWDQRQFGENIGYLPQDVQLFPASIKANIARMRDDASDADIYEAARLADVHEMIASLPHGYETMVAADGSPLSGGQKQRVALARAFFGNPRMVVLDEPNSNLDAAGDVALARALEHAKQQKITVITVTQRPSLLKSVDKILLLVNGTVALFGLRQEVLQAMSQRGLSIEGGSFGHQIQ